MFAFTVFTLLCIANFAKADQVAATAAAAQFSLTTSTLLPFPTATQATADAQKHILAQWSLAKGRFLDGADNIAFVADPFPGKPAPGVPVSTSTGPVMQITYPEGGFAHDGSGAQFYSLWNTTGGTFGSMMLSYELAFDAAFDWVKGGKLPGLRGGIKPTGCSGGNKTSGDLDCFSYRLMWRKNGAGEIYAYAPTSDSLCSKSSVTCNSDSSVSIGRGSFTLIAGQWLRVTQFIKLNDPPQESNGEIYLYFNDVLVTHETGLQIRESATVAANGFYLSTFFGGSDSSSAPPNTTHTFYRNIQLWGSVTPSKPSDSKPGDSKPSDSLATYKPTLGLGMSLTAVIAAFFYL